MGNSQSVNVAKSITDIIAKVSTDVVQGIDLSNINSQIISISNSGGDVNISNNVFTQTATINMTSLLDSLSSQQASEKIRAEMEQLAKSIVSGLNFFTFTDAKNTADLLINNTVNILTSIKQSCATTVNNLQSITIQQTKGSVYIQNNLFSQMSSIINQCALKSISNNSVVQDVQNKINQSATSELKGFNLIWLILLCAAIVVAPIFAATTTIGKTFKYIFPILAAIGLIFIAIYFATGKIIMKTYYYTKPYSTICTTATSDATINTQTSSVQTALDICLKSNTCQAVDGRLTEKSATGIIQERAVPQFSYYSKICNGNPEMQPESATSFPKADLTSFKTKQRYQWMLYVGIATLIGGSIGFLVQNRGGGLFRRKLTVSNDIEMSPL
jgi:hypothetical protein